VRYVKHLYHKPLRPQARSSDGQGLTWCDALSCRLADWKSYNEGETHPIRFVSTLESLLPMRVITVQVAVKRLHTSNAPASAESLFLREIQSLQLASGICHRACRMLGLCKLDGDACIVMTLYPKSAAKRLEELQGQCAVVTICSSCCALDQVHQAGLAAELNRKSTQA
jgi:hypothetical protein